LPERVASPPVDRARLRASAHQYLDLDVHKESVTIAVLLVDAKVPTCIAKHPDDPATLRRVCEPLASPTRHVASSGRGSSQRTPAEIWTRPRWPTRYRQHKVGLRAASEVPERLWSGLAGTCAAIVGAVCVTGA
jgi:hypothetical protein